MLEEIVVLQTIEIPVVPHILAEMLQHKVKLHWKSERLAVQPESGIDYIVSLVAAFHFRVYPQFHWVDP